MPRVTIDTDDLREWLETQSLIGEHGCSIKEQIEDIVEYVEKHGEEIE